MYFKEETKPCLSTEYIKVTILRKEEKMGRIYRVGQKYVYSCSHGK